MPCGLYSKRQPPCPVVDLRNPSSLGSRRLGKAKVDCGFLPKPSKWGVNDQQQQAAILRFRLSFIEPLGHKLASADVHLTFEGNDTGSSPPSIDTEHVHPSVMCGPPLTHKERQDRTYMPQADVPGIVSFSGLGSASSTDWESTRRWMFQSHASQVDDSASNYYTKVIWTWQANKYNEQNELKPPISTGIIINHWGQPFKTRLNIKMKSMEGFRRYIRTMQSEVPSYRQFYPPDGATENLEAFAAALKATIEDENREKVMEYEPGIADLSKPKQEAQEQQEAQEPQDLQASSTAHDPIASLVSSMAGVLSAS